MFLPEVTERPDQPVASNSSGRAGEDLGAFEGYLEGFHHGMPAHGGFAIGFERWVARVASNVREVTVFPHDRHRLSP
jgi:nondiscriminating aspartyl-tRNA synthetase